MPDASSHVRAIGYRKALELLESCRSEAGFLASTNQQANYRRIWGRDSCIMGLAALLTGRSDLVDCCRRTLETLVAHQGPHGEIPSNVDPETDRVSYGGTTGRIDSDLWFVIASGQYLRRTGDHDFLSHLLKPLERVRFLLGAWEFNTRGLLYVPITGDWADEYIHNGYVLYDQLLYLQAQREFCGLHDLRHGSRDHDLDRQVARLKHLIQANYWIAADGEEVPDDVYHEVLYEKSRSVAAHHRDRYWLSFFTPAGYGYRFDAFANVLASLFGVASKSQAELVDRYLHDEVGQEEVGLVPAFYPPITPQDEDWDDLQMTFSYVFKNNPNEYHNGGLWPMVTGFYAADLARRGKLELARHYLEGVHRANALPMEGADWSFPEFLHGEKHTPGGAMKLGWSAAAAVIAHHAVEGQPVFL
jgi:glycogen debranching enzyme